MKNLQARSLVICEEQSIARQLKSTLTNKISIQLAKDFSPNGIPFIYIFYTDTPLANHGNIYAELQPFTRKHTIATGRVPAGATIPINQPPGTVLLPWLPDNLFLSWIAVLGHFAPPPAFARTFSF